MRLRGVACTSMLACALVGCANGADLDDRVVGGGIAATETTGADWTDTDVGSTGLLDEEEMTGSTGATFDEVSEYIFSLGHLAVGDFKPKTQADCLAADCPEDGQEGDEWCEYVHYEETIHAHDFVAFQPNSATLWPGNVVQGADAEYGVLTPIGLPRAPMTFSVSLENLNGTAVGTMESPSLSSFREQRNEILAAGTSGSVPAQLAYSMSKVFNMSQVAVSLGGSLDWFGGGLSSMFDFENTQMSTKILVDFTQAYYTIDIDTPGLPSDFFTDDVTVDELEHYMDLDNPPMYVQSITYGRRVIFAVESSYAAEEVKFAFDASFDAFVVGGGIEIDTAYSEILEQSRISALVLGGAGSDAIKTVFGFEGLIEYLQDGAEYSKDSPGAPIGYRLAYLDNTGTKLAFTTDYSERQCYDNFIDVTGEVARIEDLGGNEANGIEVFGHLEFRVAEAADPDPCRPDAPDWQVIFDRNDNGAQDVYGAWIPVNPIQKTVYDLQVDPANSLCIKGHLKEADNCWLFCSNDDYGTAALGPIPLQAGWAGDYTLEFSDEGTVAATVRISVD